MLRTLIFSLLVIACNRPHTEFAVMTRVDAVRFKSDPAIPDGTTGKTIVMCRQTDTM